MNHLKEVGLNYFEHLLRAWKIAFVLLVHGFFPSIWSNKASTMLCNKDSSTYKRLMEHYNINLE